ncbi:MAG TPA: HTTM domain-containing protein [Polyangiaceae bacterium]|nr:HTTM domain-containing protein [Polyangiaceae bacterium]
MNGAGDTSFGRRFWAWYSPPTPRERLQLLRFAVGGYALIYLLSRAVHLNAVVGLPASSFAPVGVVRWLDAPLAAGWVYALYAASVVSGAAFTFGVLYRASAPLFGLLLLWVLSYRHSWGMIFHTDNLLVLHVLLLAPAPAGGNPWLASAASESANGDTGYGWVPRAMGLVTVAAYVVAGVAKLEHTGWSWAAGGALREQVAYDAIRKIELGSTYSPLGAWLVTQAWVFAPLSAFSLATELLAPLALVGTRAALIWCACAWSFHAGVLALMAIAFPYPLSGCAFLPLFPLERSLPWLRRRWPRLARPRRAPAVASDAPGA